MKPDSIGGKRLSVHDKKLLTKLATCHTIRRVITVPPFVRFELTEKGREEALAARVEESDVIRFAHAGWIELQGTRFEITQKGIEVLKSGVVKKALKQERLL